MVTVVRVDLRREDGDYVFSTLRFLTKVDDLERMQVEYPFPLTVIRRFYDFYGEDLEFLFSRFAHCRIEGNGDLLWFYAYPQLLNYIEKCTEEDIKNQRYFPEFKQSGEEETR